MMVLAFTAVAFVFALVLPLRWSVWGYLGAAALLFLIQATLNTATGFEGTSIEESLLLFNGSMAAYIGFNLQITYRAFALPLLALSAVLIWRMRKAQA